ncbi:hypothetical protein SOVF_203780 [Spinacia oleracea]|nr:hypothetical protein SOVF_203780 [Spinacia oleracea]
MGKRFTNFRISRVIPTFHSCRSKHPSTLPTNPVPSFLHYHHHPPPSTTTTTTFQQLTLSTPSSSRSSITRHVSSAIRRHGCLRSHSSPEPSHTESSSTTHKLKLPSNWHVICNNYDSTPPRRKIYNSAASDTDHDNDNDVVFLPPPPPTKIRTTSRKTMIKTRRRRRRNFQNKDRNRISTSSDSGIFSEDDDDRESPSPRIIHRHVSKSKERENSEKSKKNRRSFESTTPARLSAFMRKMAPCREVVADGKVRESFAVVKRSEDPLEDFKRSMAEMVVEKQMFEERELEELLRCFLSLNSENHHEAIVRAFTEIWEGLFCQSVQSNPRCMKGDVLDE